MRRKADQFIFVCALLALATPVSGAIFGPDSRQYVSTAPGSVYSPIGMVTHWQIPAVFGLRTTGFLVDDCHVLTAQHIFGDKKSPVGRHVRFIGALGTSKEVSSVGVVVAAGGFTKIRTPAEQYDARGRDWLLLRLDQCLGRTLGHVKLNPGPYSPGNFVNLQDAGYPVDRNSHAGLSLDPSCRLIGGRGGAWLNDCATMPGNSGGPIFQVYYSNGKQQLEVFAMQNAGWSLLSKSSYVPPGWENQATSVSMITPAIQRFLGN